MDNDDTKKDVIILVPIIDDAYKWFSTKAFDSARADLNNLFMIIFNRARTLAIKQAEKSSGQIKIQDNHWKRAYWAIIEEENLVGRYGYWKPIVRWANKVIPIFIGFFIDPKIFTEPLSANFDGLKYGFFILFVYVVTVLIEEKMEGK